ncbi:FtsX-like permease family protein [Herbaspirillum sp. RV1423]|uniref:FtsX-like permease family protein n=1 Tax=Herbaspirillum sp. RV1423 TaxID=1443993 RepID=UPI0004AE98A5|nr:FtsX-like permease family protein [Herbaspirillum sp. RV1423]
MNLPFSTRLALRQLQYKGFGLLAPFAGVCVAVILVFIQLGFKDALTGSVLNFDRALSADIVIAGRQFETIAYSPPWFARSAIYQAQGVPGVKKVTPVYIYMAQIRANERGDLLATRFIGFDPADEVLTVPGLDVQRSQLRLPYTALLDARSRNQLADMVPALEQGKTLRIHLQNPVAGTATHIDMIGTYSLGPDFTFPGSLVVSDLNFYRLFQQPADRVSLGLVTLQPGGDPERVRNALAARLGDNVQVWLHRDFVEAERQYFTYRTPVGIVTTFGIVVGILIGVVFILEVLHGIIESNLSEYAVLRAMGYGNGFCLALVLQLAVAVAVAAFAASLLITLLFYRLLEQATLLSFTLEPGMTLTVCLATLIMSMLAVVFALRKLLSSNPIDLFA